MHLRMSCSMNLSSIKIIYQRHNTTFNRRWRITFALLSGGGGGAFVLSWFFKIQDSDCYYTLMYVFLQISVFLKKRFACFAYFVVFNL